MSLDGAAKFFVEMYAVRVECQGRESEEKGSGGNKSMSIGRRVNRSEDFGRLGIAEGKVIAHEDQGSSFFDNHDGRVRARRYQTTDLYEDFFFAKFAFDRDIADTLFALHALFGDTPRMREVHSPPGPHAAGEGGSWGMERIGAVREEGGY